MGFTNIAYVELIPPDVSSNNTLAHLILENRFEKKICNFYPICLLYLDASFWKHKVFTFDCPYNEMLLTTPHPFDMRDYFLKMDLLLKMSKICYDKDEQEKKWEKDYYDTFVNPTNLFLLDIVGDYYSDDEDW